jgi:acyl-lipid omega-6 desaturase (Delta-12 desaturase)
MLQWRPRFCGRSIVGQYGMTHFRSARLRLPQLRRTFLSTIRRLCRRLWSRVGDPAPDRGCPIAQAGAACGWRELVAPFARADNLCGTVELCCTAVPFLLLVVAIFYCLDHEIWGGLVLIPPAAAFLVRLFVIQHDCGHGSYFRSRWANDVLGRIIGVFTLTPYAYWRQDHAVHHATSGNLSRRGTGDIATLTVCEYLSRPALRRLLYRLYRHPVVLFAIGPAYQFLLVHRLPRGHPVRSRNGWLSVLGTNAALAGAGTTVVLLFGWRPLVLGYLPVALLAGSIGVWLFYVQHQFQDTYWQDEAHWDFQTAAFEGCSLYDLPGVLHWLTGHIGLHHIHHLASRVPSYRLRAAFEAIPAFHQVRRLRLRKSFDCAKLALWDERQGRLVRFADIGA